MLQQEIKLLPLPQSMAWQEGVFAFGPSAFIYSLPEGKDQLYPVMKRLQETIEANLKIKLPILFHGQAFPGTAIVFTFSESLSREAYCLKIQPQGIEILYHDPSGAFYAVSTLKQLLAQTGPQIPCVEIIDKPDYPNRGLMLDIARNKIPSMKTLYRIIDLMADIKFNQLQLYMEGFPFAYPSFPQVWKDGTPVTGQEFIALDRYCKERFIELVPNQNSFGHMTDWLDRPEFSDMAECPEGFHLPWEKEIVKPGTLDPKDPRSLKLVAAQYDDLLPYFSSELFNVGCDETFELGKGKSKEQVEEKGAGRVYLEYLLKNYQLVKERGKRMMFWGDIINNDPELVSQLPKDVIALEWGYEDTHPFREHSKLFREAGVSFYVCPGTSSWNTLTGRTENMKENQLSAAVSGRDNGAEGYLITDWGDLGHWQYLPVSYPGFLYGAALCWGVEKNRDIDTAGCLDRFVFKDRTGTLGKLLMDLGNYYLKEGKKPINCSNIFTILRMELEDMDCMEGITSENLAQVEAYVMELEEKLSSAVPECDDAELILAELRNAILLIRHGVHKGQFKLKLQKKDISAQDAKGLLHQLYDEISAVMTKHLELWMERNRAGGLLLSLGRMEKIKNAYSRKLEEMSHVNQ